jgi:hypothetical protein
LRRIEIGTQYVLLEKVGIHRIRPRQSIGEQMDLKIGGFGAPRPLGGKGIGLGFQIEDRKLPAQVRRH